MQNLTLYINTAEKFNLPAFRDTDSSGSAGGWLELRLYCDIDNMLHFNYNYLPYLKL